MKKLIYAAIILILTVLLLSYPKECLNFALHGLDLWFNKMIPTLFPFMVLSGMLIRLNLIDKLMMIFNPLLKPLFRLKSAVLYAVVIGFLCGFPMGARVVADLYERQLITKNEATYLLAFVNNIGPIYFISFALVLLSLPASPALLIGMYGIPLGYGLFLRYTLYRHKISSVINLSQAKEKTTGLFKALDNSIIAGVEGITKLGGYMIFFNMLNIIPHLVINNEVFSGTLSGILEITGGLKNLGGDTPIISLTLITFGGLSCLAQTYSCIAKTDLSIKNYFIHKIILTILTSSYYVLVFMFPRL